MRNTLVLLVLGCILTYCLCGPLVKKNDLESLFYQPSQPHGNEKQGYIYYSGGIKVVDWNYHFHVFFTEVTSNNQQYARISRVSYKLEGRKFKDGFYGYSGMGDDTRLLICSGAKNNCHFHHQSKYKTGQYYILDESLDKLNGLARFEDTGKGIVPYGTAPKAVATPKKTEKKPAKADYSLLQIEDDGSDSSDIEIMPVIQKRNTAAKKGGSPKIADPKKSPKIENPKGKAKGKKAQGQSQSEENKNADSQCAEGICAKASRGLANIASCIGQACAAAKNYCVGVLCGNNN
ncbi:ribosomal protein S12 methylthiotransferase RimO [Acrasis kona]|uniref:Ribosomal protein S12 methylthiotransferase RimO n=1 Tax=Acrasis kona TaxID=1008807 RepID=A0AAW2ZG49_9EUKA